MKAFVFAFVLFSSLHSFADEGFRVIDGGEAVRQGFVGSYNDTVGILSTGRPTAINPDGSQKNYPPNNRSGRRGEIVIFKCMRYYPDGRIWDLLFSVELEYRSRESQIIQTNIGTNYPVVVYTRPAGSTYFLTELDFAKNTSYSYLQTATFKGQSVIVQTIAIKNAPPSSNIDSLILCKPKSALL